MMMKYGRKVEVPIAESRLSHLEAIRASLIGKLMSVDGFSTTACRQTTLRYAR